MNAKKLSWIFGLALLVVGGGIGWATYTGKVAFVSMSGYSVSVQAGTRAIPVECHMITYTSFDHETEIITGHSSGLLPESITGGRISSARLSMLSIVAFVEPDVMWGRTNFDDSRRGNIGANEVSYGCMAEARVARK